MTDASPSLVEKVALLAAALDRLSPHDRDFATSLIASFRTGRGLSPKQRPWIDTLLKRANPAEAQATGQVDLAGVHTVFATARANGAKRPAIVLQTLAGARIRLSPAGEESNNPGCVYVKVDGDYAGKVDPAGAFHPTRDTREAGLADGIVAALAEMADDPVAAAQRFARETGECCFCAKRLDDERSVAVGYGPNCAKKYSLPYPSRAELRSSTSPHLSLHSRPSA